MRSHNQKLHFVAPVRDRDLTIANVETLVARAEIADLLNRYARGVDATIGPSCGRATTHDAYDDHGVYNGDVEPVTGAAGGCGVGGGEGVESEVVNGAL